MWGVQRTNIKGLGLRGGKEPILGGSSGMEQLGSYGSGLALGRSKGLLFGKTRDLHLVQGDHNIS